MKERCVLAVRGTCPPISATSTIAAGLVERYISQDVIREICCVLATLAILYT